MKALFLDKDILDNTCPNIEDLLPEYLADPKHAVSEIFEAVDYDEGEYDKCHNPYCSEDSTDVDICVVCVSRDGQVLEVVEAHASVVCKERRIRSGDCDTSDTKILDFRKSTCEPGSGE